MYFLDIIQGIRDLSVLKSTVEQSDRKMIMSPNSQRKTSMSHFSHKKESQTKNELYEDPNYFLNESDLSSPKHGRLNMVSLCGSSFNYKFVKFKFWYFSWIVHAELVCKIKLKIKNPRAQRLKHREQRPSSNERLLE